MSAVGIIRETVAAVRAATELTGALVRESAGVTPPPRTPAGSYQRVTMDTALSLSDVYRALTIHATAAMQLDAHAERRGARVATDPAMVLQPDLNMDRTEWVEQSILSLAGDGNLFWHLTRRDGDPAGEVVNARVVAPQLVTVSEDDHGRKVYGYAGEAGHAPATWRAHECSHVKLLSLPGKLRGLGPIQAAQVELRGALQLRDYSALWFDPEAGAAMPNATLETDQTLTPTQAKAWAAEWHKDRTHRTRVLGNGLTFKPNILSPKDAQFLESRTFTVPQLARLFGLPASLMLAVLEGNSQTYANVEQDWIAYVRFSLMQYLTKVEAAWSALLPRGMRVRFDTSSLLRSDTLTRYQGHQLGISAGFLTPNEARGVEGLAPLPGGDVLRSPAAPPPATTTPDLEATPDA